MSQITKTDDALMCTVVSLVPFPIREHKPGLIPNTFIIEPSDTKEPKLLHVGHAQHYVYIDDTRPQLLVRDGADEVARSIVEDYKNSQLARTDGVEPGIFWIPGKLSVAEVKEKYKDQLLTARLSQTHWLTALCKVADDDWSRYHKHTCISDTQRKAANLLGLKADEHEWLGVEAVINASRCPNCQMPVAENQAVCGNCRAVINKERAKELTFV